MSLKEWRKILKPIEKDNYMDTFISIFYDKDDSTFLEAAQQMKALYSIHVPPNNILINSFKEVNIDNHFQKIEEYNKYIFHYIGHGDGGHDDRWPTIILKQNGEDTIFNPVKILHGNEDLATKSILIIMDCCNYVPGKLEYIGKSHTHGIKILLNLKGHNIISSSKKGLYSYFFKGVNTLFTQAIYATCDGDYKDINDFLTTLNNNLLKMYITEELIIDNTGKIIDSNIEFDYNEIKKINPEKQVVIKRAIEKMQATVTSGNVNPMIGSPSRKKRNRGSSNNTVIEPKSQTTN